MGQYFVLVNSTKKEYVGSLFMAKLTEILHDPAFGVVMAYLITDKSSNGDSRSDLDDTVVGELFGSWCNDKVTLVGDYSSNMPDLNTHTDISVALGTELAEVEEEYELNTGIGKRVRCMKAVSKIQEEMEQHDENVA